MPLSATEKQICNGFLAVLRQRATFQEESLAQLGRFAEDKSLYSMIDRALSTANNADDVAYAQASAMRAPLFTLPSTDGKPDLSVLAKYKAVDGAKAIVSRDGLQAFLVNYADKRALGAIAQQFPNCADMGVVSHLIYATVCDNGGGNMKAVDGTSDADAVINHWIQVAIDRGASDVHFDPRPATEEGGHRIVVEVSLRIFGQMTPVDEIKDFQKYLDVVNRMLQRIKKNAGEYQKPVGGSLVYERGSAGKVQVRLEVFVAAVSNDLVPKATLRVPNLKQKLDRLEKLNIPQYPGNNQYAELRRLGTQPSGLFAVTGPTGSGKTSTFYALLRWLKEVAPTKQIITIEDPVEQQLYGIVQAQVNELAGFTFANALRSFLRSDPDVILVGEIRDEETAELAIKAAMTGHMVFTTLHTNNAVGAVARLRELGIEPGFLASNIKGVMAQRLVGELCPHCRMPEEWGVLLLGRSKIHQRREGEVMRSRYASLAARYGDLQFFPKDPKHKVYFRNPDGCAKCSNTGITGRRIISELLTVDQRLGRIIKTTPSDSDLEHHAIKHNGFKPMWESAMHLVHEGVVSMDACLEALGDREAELVAPVARAASPVAHAAAPRPADPAQPAAPLPAAIAAGRRG